jgi:hypothetical protein
MMMIIREEVRHHQTIEGKGRTVYANQICNIPTVKKRDHTSGYDPDVRIRSLSVRSREFNVINTFHGLMLSGAGITPGDVIIWARGFVKGVRSAVVATFLV